MARLPQEQQHRPPLREGINRNQRAVVRLPSAQTTQQHQQQNPYFGQQLTQRKRPCAFLHPQNQRQITG